MQRGEKTMPNLYVLVGVPGSGKSTWVSKQNWDNNAVYVSSDKYIDEYAASVGKTYSDVFASYIKTATRLMLQDVEEARAAGYDIVWDQTSTTKAARAKKLRMLASYRAVAVVFPTPAEEELNRRLKQRVGKNIPSNVMKQMIDNFEQVELSEGFSEIITNTI